MAAHFRPELQSYMINGRPMQASPNVQRVGPLATLLFVLLLLSLDRKGFDVCPSLVLALPTLTIEALVISHNSAPAWDWNPYMSYALRPLNPVVLLGVTGRSIDAPKMQYKYSVMEWWKVRQGKGPSVEVSVLEMRVAPPRVPPF